MEENRETRTISNIEIDDDQNLCKVSINPSIYHIDVVYSAAYVFLDKAYVLIDGDPYEKIIVELKPKESNDGYDLEKLGREFNNELLSYSNYKKRSEESMEIRNILLQRALLTNAPSEIEAPRFEEENMDDNIPRNEKIDDPEGIAIPWEEKYGKRDAGKEDAQ